MIRRFLAVAAASATALIVSPAAHADPCMYSVGGYTLNCSSGTGGGSTGSYGTGSYGTGSYGTGSSTDSYGTGSDNT